MKHHRFTFKWKRQKIGAGSEIDSTLIFEGIKKEEEVHLLKE